MDLIDSQYAVVDGNKANLPLLPWTVIRPLLWDIHIEVFEEMNILAEENDWHFTHFIDSYTHLKNHSIVITDTDLRIQCASENVWAMTSYENYELIGHTPRILQGEATDVNTKKLISHAIENSLSFQARLVNFKKNGTAYGCEIKAFPIFNGLGDTCHFIAFEQEYYI